MTEQDDIDQALAKLRDKSWRMNHLYKIQTKDKRLVTYKRKLAQSNYALRKTLRNLILKARQLGFTTECLIDLFDDTINTPNTNTAIIAHKQDKVVKLFEIVKRAHENMPEQLKPRVSFDNRNELYFPDLDSKIYVTMDSRGETVHNMHISEAHFIKNAEQMMAGTLEAVPKDGRITLESTGNGVAGYFYNEWDDASSEFTKHFYNWMWDPDYFEEPLKSAEELDAEYRYLATRYGTILDIKERFSLTLPQFQWYISKVKRHKELVVQEYPTTALEAFLATGRNVFHRTDIAKHQSLFPIERKWGDCLIWEKPLKNFKYVIGIDPAEGHGGDNSVIEVFNAHTGEHAAEYATNFIPPDRLGLMGVEIGKYYNNALIVVESNNHGHATINAMKTKYMNLYRRENMDKATKETTYTLGWNSNIRTKSLLVDNLEESVRDMTITVRSEEALKELKMFVQTDIPGKHGYGAEGSGKDDRVIAMGLCVQGIKNIPRQKKPETQAEKRMKEYVVKHGLPTYFNDDRNEDRPSPIITRHARPNSGLR